MIETYEIAEMRAQGDFEAYRKAVHRQAIDLRNTRRAAVLAHPDLAERLKSAPLSVAEPRQWSGFVPPATVERRHSASLINSPVRAQLVAIVTEAQRRDGRDYGVDDE